MKIRFPWGERGHVPPDVTQPIPEPPPVDGVITPEEAAVQKETAAVLMTAHPEQGLSAERQQEFAVRQHEQTDAALRVSGETKGTIAVRLDSGETDSGWEIASITRHGVSVRKGNSPERKTVPVDEFLHTNPQLSELQQELIHEAVMNDSWNEAAVENAVRQKHEQGDNEQPAAVEPTVYPTEPAVEDALRQKLVARGDQSAGAEPAEAVAPAETSTATPTAEAAAHPVEQRVRKPRTVNLERHIEGGPQLFDLSNREQVAAIVRNAMYGVQVPPPEDTSKSAQNTRSWLEFFKQLSTGDLATVTRELEASPQAFEILFGQLSDRLNSGPPEIARQLETVVHAMASRMNTMSIRPGALGATIGELHQRLGHTSTMEMARAVTGALDAEKRTWEVGSERVPVSESVMDSIKKVLWERYEALRGVIAILPDAERNQITAEAAAFMKEDEENDPRTKLERVEKLSLLVDKVEAANEDRDFRLQVARDEYGAALLDQKKLRRGKSTAERLGVLQNDYVTAIGSAVQAEVDRIKAAHPETDVTPEAELATREAVTKLVIERQAAEENDLVLAMRDEQQQRTQKSVARFLKIDPKVRLGLSLGLLGASVGLRIAQQHGAAAGIDTLRKGMAIAGGAGIGDTVAEGIRNKFGAMSELKADTDLTKLSDEELDRRQAAWDTHFIDKGGVRGTVQRFDGFRFAKSINPAQWVKTRGDDTGTRIMAERQRRAAERMMRMSSHMSELGVSGTRHAAALVEQSRDEQQIYHAAHRQRRDSDRRFTGVRVASAVAGATLMAEVTGHHGHAATKASVPHSEHGAVPTVQTHETPHAPHPDSSHTTSTAEADSDAWMDQPAQEPLPAQVASHAHHAGAPVDSAAHGTMSHAAAGHEAGAAQATANAHEAAAHTAPTAESGGGENLVAEVHHGDTLTHMLHEQLPKEIQALRDNPVTRYQYENIVGNILHNAKDHGLLTATDHAGHTSVISDFGNVGEGMRVDFSKALHGIDMHQLQEHAARLSESQHHAIDASVQANREWVHNHPGQPLDATKAMAEYNDAHGHIDAPHTEAPHTHDAGTQAHTGFEHTHSADTLTPHQQVEQLLGHNVSEFALDKHLNVHMPDHTAHAAPGHVDTPAPDSSHVDADDHVDTPAPDSSQTTHGPQDTHGHDAAHVERIPVSTDTGGRIDSFLKSLDNLNEHLAGGKVSAIYVRNDLITVNAHDAMRRGFVEHFLEGRQGMSHDDAKHIGNALRDLLTHLPKNTIKPNDLVKDVMGRLANEQGVTR